MKTTLLKVFCITLALALLLAVSGCTAIGLVQDLKAQTGVMDAGIHVKGDTLTCEVILDDDASAPAEADADSYLAIVQKAFPDKTVILNVVRDGVTLMSVKGE